VSSVEGRGSTFSIVLPVSRPDDFSSTSQL
jgi:hypothetical protein